MAWSENWAEICMHRVRNWVFHSFLYKNIFHYIHSISLLTAHWSVTRGTLKSFWINQCCLFVIVASLLDRSMKSKIYMSITESVRSIHAGFERNKISAPVGGYVICRQHIKQNLSLLISVFLRENVFLRKL